MQFDYITYLCVFLAVYMPLLILSALVKYTGAVYTLNAQGGSQEALQRFVGITNRVLGKTYAVQLIVTAVAIAALISIKVS